MRIAVTDACIFIDLIELEIIADFFKLDIEVHTSIDVLGELFPSQKQILMAYHATDKLMIHNLESDDLEQIDHLNLPLGLSREDQTVIYIASTMNSAIILSSDGLVRKVAKRMSIEYHGLFWVFDQLVQNRHLSKNRAISKLEQLTKSNTLYSSSQLKKEVGNRKANW